MWMCTKHIKEKLSLLETPHVTKASYQIKCSLCDNLASAKIHYTYLTYQFTKKQPIDSSPINSAKQIS